MDCCKIFDFHGSVTITVLDIIHRPVYYLKHSVSETGVCPRIQVEPTQLGPINRTNLLLFPEDGDRIQNVVFDTLSFK
jgi:hypothetical protein